MRKLQSAGVRSDRSAVFDRRYRRKKGDSTDAIGDTIRNIEKRMMDDAGDTVHAGRRSSVKRRDDLRLIRSEARRILYADPLKQNLRGRT